VRFQGLLPNHMLKLLQKMKIIPKKAAAFFLRILPNHLFFPRVIAKSIKL